MPSYRCPKGERFKNCKRYLGLVFAITLSYSLYFQKRKIVFLFRLRTHSYLKFVFICKFQNLVSLKILSFFFFIILNYFCIFSIFKIIIHFYFIKYNVYAPKYLFNNPSNPLPCLASSLHISCTVS